MALLILRIPVHCNGKCTVKSSEAEGACGGDSSYHLLKEGARLEPLTFCPSYVLPYKSPMPYKRSLLT